MKIYREVKASDRLPSYFGKYYTDIGLIFYNNGIKQFECCSIESVKYWFESVELPSGDEVCLQSSNEEYQRDGEDSYEQGHNDGANYILDFLKK